MAGANQSPILGLANLVGGLIQRSKNRPQKHRMGWFHILLCPFGNGSSRLTCASRHWPAWGLTHAINPESAALPSGPFFKSPGRAYSDRRGHGRCSQPAPLQSGALIDSIDSHTQPQTAHLHFGPATWLACIQYLVSAEHTSQPNPLILSWSAI